MRFTKSLSVSVGQFFLTCSILFISSCSAGSEGEKTYSFDIQTEDGVPCAVTTGGPLYKESIFEYEETVRLEQDETREETILYRAYSYLLGEDGCFYVEDRGNDRIAVFGPDGKYMRSIGREGDGPGEFRNPTIQWIRGENLSLWDSQNRRTSFFKTDGTYLRSFSYSRGGTFLRQLHPLDDGRMVLINFESEATRSDEDRFTWYAATVVTPEGDTLARIESPRYNSGRMILLEEYMMGIATSPIFGARSLVSFHPENGILCYIGSEPVLRWYGTDGQLSRIIRIEMPPEPVTDEDRSAWEQRYRDQEEEAEEEMQKALARAMRKHMVFADAKAFWTTVTVDDLGYYWLAYHIDYTVAEEDRYPVKQRVLSPEGEYLGDTVWPERRGQVSRGHFLGFYEEEETGILIPVVYKISSAIPGWRYP